nr:MAG TPA: hypothetical protein [Caudoviricetes sp.]
MFTFFSNYFKIILEILLQQCLRPLLNFFFYIYS